MSSDREEIWLGHIIEECNRVAGFVDGMKLSDFESRLVANYAVERALLRIAEATKRIGPERFTTLIDEPPYFLIVGLGNKLRHEYETIKLSTIFETATIDLPLLAQACRKALGDL